MLVRMHLFLLWIIGGASLIHYQFMNQEAKEEQRRGNPATISIRHLQGYLPERYALPQGYSACPSPQYLFANHGKCSNLTIATPHGEALWEGSLDLSALQHPLGRTFRMAHCEIEVYQQGCATPPLGAELNRPCQVTFQGGKRMDQRGLMQVCRKNGSRLVKLCEESGNFTVLLPHFTKYNFNQEADTEKKARSRDLPQQPPQQQQPSHRNIIIPDYESSSRQTPAFPNSTMQIQKRSFSLSPSAIPQIHSSETVSQDNPIPFLMNALRGRPDNTNNIQQKVFEKICGLIESDKVYYNKEIPPGEPMSEDQLLSVQNRYRERAGCKDVQQVGGVRMGQVLVGSGSIVTSKRFQCDSQPFLEVITVSSHQQALSTPKLHPKSFHGLITHPYEFTPFEVASICTDQAFSLQVRRLFSLYSVLFQDEVYLYIGRNNYLEYSMWLLDAPRENRGSARAQLFKNWLAWVSAAELNFITGKDDLFLHNSEVSKALALRKPETAIDFLYVNNRWEDAQVLINIEDPSFRTYYASLNSYILAPQLEDILSESVKKLSKGVHDWFLLMAFSVWYLMREPFLDNLQTVVEMTDAAQVTHLQEEFRMIQVFLAKEGRKLEKSCLFTPGNRDLTEEKLACLYLMSNSFQLAPYEQAIITNAQDGNLKRHLYAMYRHELLTKLTDLPQNQSQLRYLLMNDGFITQQERQKRLRKLSPRGEGEGSQEEDTINAANDLISKGRTLEGLKLLFGLKNWDEQLFHRVCQLVTLPSLLTHFKQSVNLSLRDLLLRRGETFADLLLILAVGRREKLSGEESMRVVEILQGKSRFEQYLQPPVRSFLANGLERLIQQAIVLRNDFLELLNSDREAMRTIETLFKNKMGNFKKVEEAAATI